MPRPALRAACASILTPAPPHRTPARLARTAQREFRVLERVEHLGIQRALDYREAELGPALVFEHDPSAPRLDRFLAQPRGKSLSLLDRLALVRQSGDA